MRNPLKYRAGGGVTVEYQAYNDLKQDHARENQFKSFEEFISAVGPRPTDGCKVLRRRDASKPYQAGNVFWGTRDVSPAVQANVLISLLRKALIPVNIRCHGMTGTTEYRSLQCAKQRCNNPRNIDYRNYGGRGVRVLFPSFAHFFACLGHKPEGYSLDRLNPFGSYAPGNTAWKDSRWQHANTRSHPLNLVYRCHYEVLLDEGLTPEQAAAECLPLPGIERVKEAV